MDDCPFCEGREERTPPETFALAARARRPDTPGWLVRVVPNLYPAFQRQEVVIHGPVHVRSFSELGGEQVARVADTWQQRHRDVGEGYLLALVNEGRAAGASLPHSHSQLVWLGDPPPAVAAERHAAIADLVGLDEYAVAERDGVRLLVHPAGRVPYELLIAPVEREHDAFASGRLESALRLLADGISRLFAVEGPVPWNAWLHDSGHWHLEVLPRLTVLAGLELGAGVYVNTLPPEGAAQTLREAEAPTS